jgi:plastocyanin
MEIRRMAPIALLVATFVMLAGFLASGTAQNNPATPDTATPVANVSHPAHIHQGTCDTLGDVIFPLNNVVVPNSPAALVGDIASPVPEQEGTPVASPVAETEAAEGNSESTTIVDVALDDIISGGHAINVHESVENVANYIACGDVTGTPEGGQLRIALNELNDSGFSGDALLQDMGDGTTTVTIVLMDSNAPEASPVAGSSEEGAVAIKDFTYDSASVTIPVGGSVTWTNNDPAPHTATAQDRAVLQSGTLEQGASFTQTFTTAGTYEYFCEFHPNMKASVTVQ